MKYLRITNKGEIDIDALHLLGASTKRGDDSKIGFFGSGNKYALALLLRQKIAFHIFSGTSEVEIETRNTSFRDQSFDIMYINGERTSITTETGPKWELVDALRELWCNALDEGEAIIQEFDGLPHGMENMTSIFLPFEPFRSIWESWDQYYTTRTPIYSDFTGQGSIFERRHPTPRVYRKNVWCIDPSNLPGGHDKIPNSIFDYDLPYLPLDENRKLKEVWSLKSQLQHLWYDCKDVHLIRRLLLSLSEWGLESDIFQSSMGWTMGPVWHDLRSELEGRITTRGLMGMVPSERKEKMLVLPLGLFEDLRDQLKIEPAHSGRARFGYKEVEMSDALQERVAAWQDLMYKRGINVIYRIACAEFSDDDILGCAETRTKTIVVSKKHETLSFNELCKTLMEEYIHLRYNVSDESRGMQEAMHEVILSLLQGDPSLIGTSELTKNQRIDKQISGEISF